MENPGVPVVGVWSNEQVSVELRGQARGCGYDLLGCCAAPEEEVARGGVLAVLDATNRIVERYADS